MSTATDRGTPGIGRRQLPGDPDRRPKSAKPAQQISTVYLQHEETAVLRQLAAACGLYQQSHAHTDPRPGSLSALLRVLAAGAKQHPDACRRFITTLQQTTSTATASDRGTPPDNGHQP